MNALPIRILACAAILSAAAAQEQVTLPADTNLFGDDFPQQNQQVRGRRVVVQQAAKARPPAAGYSQTLIFQDSRQIHGELVEISKEEIVWRRPDASEPIRFPRK